MMLKIKNESDLKRHKTNRLFPGRTFYQVFARYHFLRVQSTTPEKYAEELRVCTIIVILSIFSYLGNNVFC